MPSKLDVVNQVLGELGRFPVASILNTDDAAQIISSRTDLLSLELLQRTDWNFAIEYFSSTTPLAQSFSPDFLYSYALPFNYGKFDRTSPMYPNFGLYYRIVDGMICTNANPISFYYVVNQVDYSVITPLFERALITYVASDVCLVLTNNAQLEVYLKAKYDEKLNDALRSNDQERYIQSTPYNDFDRMVYV